MDFVKTRDAGREMIFFRKPYFLRRRFKGSPFTPTVFLDIALLFLLFLTTVHFSELVIRPGISLDLPVSDFQDGSHFQKFDTILITLSREGMVFFNDELTTLDGLAPAIAQAGHADKDSSILIQADSSIDYGTLIGIFNMAADAGIEDVTLASGIAPERVDEP